MAKYTYYCLDCREEFEDERKFTLTQRQMYPCPNCGHVNCLSLNNPDSK